jgi:hypothetical protein
MANKIVGWQKLWLGLLAGAYVVLLLAILLIFFR